MNSPSHNTRACKMPAPALHFHPNPAFGEHIAAIRASDSNLSLVEIHMRLLDDLPGADISFADVVSEILEQSRSRLEKRDH